MRAVSRSMTDVSARLRARSHDERDGDLLRHVAKQIGKPAWRRSSLEIGDSKLVCIND